jgi:N6-L-threonylcarbamoyladenine synthase
MLVIMHVQHRIVLGIETSCDEVAASIYDSGKSVLSNVLYSQIELHRLYGGVIPEIASRSMIEKINVIIAQALDDAKTSLDEIDCIAVTTKPGLPGSLLVGLNFAKAVAFAKQKKIIGINHLEGHAFSSCIEYNVPFPHLCLTASGGHTSLYLIQGFGEYTVLGSTLDDAAGEAFDKIAKMMQLPYPGGPLIEKLAEQVNFQDFFHYTRGNMHGLDFSFSGLKTAVMYDLVKRGLYDVKAKKFLQHPDLEIQQQISSSLLVCMRDIFETRLARALKEHPEIKAVTFVGGVASNNYLKKSLADFCKKRALEFFSPSRQYCTDNAAMIAFVGNYKAAQGLYSDLHLDIF